VSAFTVTVSALTAVLSDTFVVSVTTVVLSPVAGVVVSPPPQDVNTAVKMLSATNVTFFMSVCFCFRIKLPLITILFYCLYSNIRKFFHFAKFIFYRP